MEKPLLSNYQLSSQFNHWFWNKTKILVTSRSKDLRINLRNGLFKEPNSNSYPKIGKSAAHFLSLERFHVFDFALSQILYDRYDCLAKRTHVSLNDNIVSRICDSSVVVSIQIARWKKQSELYYQWNIFYNLKF